MTAYGPGDPATWPAYTGHANDPRNDDDECPDCDTVLTDGGCDACGWGPSEPDYEPDDPPGRMLR